jgi:glycerol-3-phosphate acyltransferase PlsY
MEFLLLTLLAYLCGSVPFGKIVGYYKGIDIQKTGSGNIGFANAVRVLGWPSGTVVLAGDVAKGFLPVAVAQTYLGEAPVMAVAAAAIFGHIFPVWLKGKGGKGVATGLGASLAINPLLAALGVGVYLVSITILRKSAPSSIIGAWSMPFWCGAFGLYDLTVFYAALGVLALWTHRANIRQLLNLSYAE